MIVDKVIIDLLENAIKDKIKAKFQNNKQELIDKINKDIDIPFINEKTEEKIFEAIWESVESVLKGVLK